MSDLKNFNEPDQEQSWQKAESLLDSHFRRKKIVRWSLALLITGVAVVCTTLLINHSSENGSVKMKSVNKGNSSALSIVQSPADPSLSMNAIEGNKKSEDDLSITISNSSVQKERSDDKSTVFNEQKRREDFELIKQKEDRKSNTKANRRAVINVPTLKQIPAVATDDIRNADHLKSVERVAEAAVAFSPKKEKSNPEVVENLPSAWHTDGSALQINESEQDLMLMKPVRLNEISIVRADPYELPDFNSDGLSISSQKPGIGLLVYGSAYYVFKKLESKKYDAYATRRMNEEEGIISGSLGASLVYELRKFSLSIGIEYSSWGEKNSYSPYLNKKTLVEKGGNQAYYRLITDTFYISGNQYFHPYQVTDSLFVSRKDTVINTAFDQQVASKNGISKFYFIEVPVELSYRMRYNRIGFGASVGISPAWLLSEKGYYLSRDVSGIEKVSEIKAVNKLMLNGRLSIDIYYHFNDRMNLLVRPQFKANLGSVFQDDYEVNQRYYSAGLVFGLLYSIK